MSDSSGLQKLPDSVRPNDGEMLPCRVAGDAFLVSKHEGSYFAIRDLCTHADQRLSEGRMRGSTVYCPLHGARFDLRNGKCLTGPATENIEAYEVIQDGDDLVLGERLSPPTS